MRRKSFHIADIFSAFLSTIQFKVIFITYTFPKVLWYQCRHRLWSAEMTLVTHNHTLLSLETKCTCLKWLNNSWTHTSTMFFPQKQDLLARQHAVAPLQTPANDKWVFFVNECSFELDINNPMIVSIRNRNSSVTKTDLQTYHQEITRIRSWQFHSLLWPGDYGAKSGSTLWMGGTVYSLFFVDHRGASRLWTPVRSWTLCGRGQTAV